MVCFLGTNSLRRLKNGLFFRPWPPSSLYCQATMSSVVLMLIEIIHRHMCLVIRREKTVTLLNLLGHPTSILKKSILHGSNIFFFKNVEFFKHYDAQAQFTWAQEICHGSTFKKSITYSLPHLRHDVKPYKCYFCATNWNLPFFPVGVPFCEKFSS